jgi:NitT/TauT family transport system ATP-binding protein
MLQIRQKDGMLSEPRSHGFLGKNFVAAHDVSKSFLAKGRSVTALSALTMTIASGEFVSIIGPSGCGKSTFLHIVAGLVSTT